MVISFLQKCVSSNIVSKQINYHKTFFCKNHNQSEKKFDQNGEGVLSPE